MLLGQDPDRVRRVAGRLLERHDRLPVGVVLEIVDDPGGNRAEPIRVEPERAEGGHAGRHQPFDPEHAAEVVFPFDEHHLEAPAGEEEREGGPGRPGTDDHRAQSASRHRENIGSAIRQLRSSTAG